MCGRKGMTDRMETDRILLRPWQESDADVLYEYASDSDVGPRAGWAPHQSREESLEIIRTVFNNPTTWAIVLKETGRVVGAMGYGPSCACALPSREGEPTVGYWVGRPYWGMGICTEALRLMLDYIRSTTDIKSVISGHFTDNPSSGRVMEKCGFTPTGETVFDNGLYMGKERPIRVLRLELCPLFGQSTRFTATKHLV
ncbi:MAG: GNAT family N-acetyltransferase [Prevotella sp.]